MLSRKSLPGRTAAPASVPADGNEVIRGATKSPTPYQRSTFAVKGVEKKPTSERKSLDPRQLLSSKSLSKTSTRDKETMQQQDKTIESLTAERDRLTNLVSQLKLEKKHLTENVISMSNEVDEVQKERVEIQDQFREDALKFAEDRERLEESKRRMGDNIVKILIDKDIDASIVQEVMAVISAETMPDDGHDSPYSHTVNNALAMGPGITPAKSAMMTPRHSMNTPYSMSSTPSTPYEDTSPMFTSSSLQQGRGSQMGGKKSLHRDRKSNSGTGVSPYALLDTYTDALKSGIQTADSGSSPQTDMPEQSVADIDFNDDQISQVPANLPMRNVDSPEAQERSGRPSMGGGLTANALSALMFSSKDQGDDDTRSRKSSRSRLSRLSGRHRNGDNGDLSETASRRSRSRGRKKSEALDRDETMSQISSVSTHRSAKSRHSTSSLHYFTRMFTGDEKKEGITIEQLEAFNRQQTGAPPAIPTPTPTPNPTPQVPPAGKGKPTPTSDSKKPLKEKQMNLGEMRQEAEQKAGPGAEGEDNQWWKFFV